MISYDLHIANAKFQRLNFHISPALTIAPSQVTYSIFANFQSYWYVNELTSIFTGFRTKHTNMLKMNTDTQQQSIRVALNPNDNLQSVYLIVSPPIEQQCHATEDVF